jgi:hypothetical protein
MVEVGRHLLLPIALLCCGFLIHAKNHTGGSGKANELCFDDCVYLPNVTEIVFHHGYNATTPTGYSALELRCAASTSAAAVSCAGIAPTLSYVKCYNHGFEPSGLLTGEQVKWDCVAKLPDTVQFGTTNIKCQPYAFDDDAVLNKDSYYVYPTSCSLEYSLVKKGTGISDADIAIMSTIGGIISFTVIVCLIGIIVIGKIEESKGYVTIPGQKEDIELAAK